MPAPSRPWPLYCDRPSVEAVLSEAGVRLRFDDDGDGQLSAGEQANLTSVLTSASDTLDFYLFNKYDPNILVNSSLVWRWASIFAAYEADRRRNNPPSESLATWAEEVEEKLQAIQERGKVLPGVAIRMSCAPTYSNVRVDLRYQFRVIRVEKGRSSPSGLSQIPDYDEAFSHEL